MSQYPFEKTKGKTINNENEKMDIEIGKQNENLLNKKVFNLEIISEQINFKGKENEKYKTNQEECSLCKNHHRMKRKSTNFEIISHFFNLKGKKMQQFEMNHESFKIEKIYETKIQKSKNIKDIEEEKENSINKKKINLEIISEQIYFRQFYSTHSHMGNNLFSFSYNSSLSSLNKRIHLNNRLNNIVLKKHFLIKSKLSKFFNY